MVYQAALAFMNEFNRVFYCNDVIVPRLVCMIDNGRESRRFSAAGGTCYQDQPLMQGGKFLHNWRKSQLLGGHDLRRNLTKNRRDAVFLAEEIRAVSRFARDFVAEIDVTRLLKHLHFEFRRDLIKPYLQLV